MANKQNQHYVPQFILRRFQNLNGKLHVYDKWTRRSFETNTKNVAAENGFYDIAIDGETVSLEPFMCEIESGALRAVTVATESGSLASITVEERDSVSIFLATQILRTRSKRDWLSQLQEAFKQILPEKNLSDEQLPAGFFLDDEGLKAQSLVNLRLAEDFSPHIIDKAWLLIQSPGDCPFMISDTPVVTHNDQRSDFRSNRGLKCPGVQIFMPLSPRLTLFCMCKTLLSPFYQIRRRSPEIPNPILDAIETGVPLAAESDSVEHQNWLQVASAARFIFSSSSDFSLADKILDKYPDLARPQQIVVK